VARKYVLLGCYIPLVFIVTLRDLCGNTRVAMLHKYVLMLLGKNAISGRQLRRMGEVMRR
jgi:hypothetical protein